MAVYAAALPLARARCSGGTPATASSRGCSPPRWPLLAAATVWCTAMIYASLKPVPQWRHPTVRAGLPAAGARHGHAAARRRALPRRLRHVPLLRWLALLALLGAWLAKELYWRGADRLTPRADRGRRHRLAPVRRGAPARRAAYRGQLPAARDGLPGRPPARRASCAGSSARWASPCPSPLTVAPAAVRPAAGPASRPGRAGGGQRARRHPGRALAVLRRGPPHGHALLRGGGAVGAPASDAGLQPRPGRLAIRSDAEQSVVTPTNAPGRIPSTRWSIPYADRVCRLACPVDPPSPGSIRRRRDRESAMGRAGWLGPQLELQATACSPRWAPWLRPPRPPVLRPAWHRRPDRCPSTASWRPAPACTLPDRRPRLPCVHRHAGLAPRRAASRSLEPGLARAHPVARAQRRPARARPALPRVRRVGRSAFRRRRRHARRGRRGAQSQPRFRLSDAPVRRRRPTERLRAGGPQRLPDHGDRVARRRLGAVPATVERRRRRSPADGATHGLEPRPEVKQSRPDRRRHAFPGSRRAPSARLAAAGLGRHVSSAPRGSAVTNFSVAAAPTR